jgi:hypothetical protein
MNKTNKLRVKGEIEAEFAPSNAMKWLWYILILILLIAAVAAFGGKVIVQLW